VGVNISSFKESSSSFRLTRWVSSQIEVLAHKNTKIFISHCGINSAHQSIYFGTLLICIPFFADQIAMAVRVSDGGVGIHLNKRRVTSQQIKESVHLLLTQESFRTNCARVSAELRLSGGAKRVADLIEMNVKYGLSHYDTIDYQLDLISYYNLDVYLVHAGLVFLWYMCFRYCCCRRSKVKIS